MSLGRWVVLSSCQSYKFSRKLTKWNNVVKQLPWLMLEKLFCWLVHHKMTFYYPVPTNRATLLHYSTICVMSSPFKLNVTHIMWGVKYFILKIGLELTSEKINNSIVDIRDAVFKDVPVNDTAPGHFSVLRKSLALTFTNDFVKSICDGSSGQQWRKTDTQKKFHQMFRKVELEQPGK